MNRPEQELQKQVASFLNMALRPDDGVTWFHVMNNPRNKVAGGIAKAMGMIAGIPDIGIIHNGRLFWIELKAPKGRVSPVQKQCHALMARCGCTTDVCRSLDDVASILRIAGVPMRAKVTG